MSPQMENLLARYGVATEAALIEAIREDDARETGRRPSKATAEVLLDRMLEAEFQRIEGGAYDGLSDAEVETQLDGAGWEPTYEEWQAEA